MQDTALSNLPLTDPTPFISLAYTLGLVGILGYVMFLILHRRKLRQLLESLSEE